MRKADHLPPSRAVVTKSGNLNFLKNPLGLSRPVVGLLYLCLLTVYSVLFMPLSVNIRKCRFRNYILCDYGVLLSQTPQGVLRNILYMYHIYLSEIRKIQNYVTHLTPTDLHYISYMHKSATLFVLSGHVLFWFL